MTGQPPAGSGALYRGYDQPALDAQYNARATVLDIGPYLNQYAQLSAHARAVLECATDVAYGDHPDETMDIFPAAGTQPAPVFMYIHGGYWRALGKDDSSFMAPAFVQAGATVAAINYSLAPAANLDQIVDQVRRALEWLVRNAARFNGDASRIHVGGSSAGGHLAAMLLAEGWHARYGVTAEAVRGAVLLSGLFDITPLVHTHINEWMRMTHEDARRNSPLFALPRRGCPIVVSCGENETDEFKRQSRDYLQAWRDLGHEGRYVDMPGTNHFDLVLALNDPDSALAQAVFRQMGLAAPRAGGAEST